MIAFAQIQLGCGETAVCMRCHPERAVSMFPAEQVVAAVGRAAAEWGAGPGPNVSFVGAEPFAHPALVRLVNAAVQAGCERIRLRTDGGALFVGGNAAGVVQAGVRHVELVLLAGDSVTHDGLADRPGLFEAAISGAGAFTEAARVVGEHVSVTGLVRVCRHNAPHLSSAVLALAKAGAVSVLVERAEGFMLPSATLAEALRVATVAGVALHGDGVSPFSAEPWTVREVAV